MDALIGRSSAHVIAEDNSRVWFGGSYEEHWTEDFKLVVSYRDRRLVEAHYIDGRWQPAGGEPTLCEALMRPDCAPFLQRYFQAAATAYAATSAVLKRGQTIERLHETLSGPTDSLVAPELLRLAMDDCGYGWEQALPEVMRACRCGPLREDEIEALKTFQPRTAQLARFLVEKAGDCLVGVHDARRPEYRLPSGAVRCGEPLRLSFDLSDATPRLAYLVIRSDTAREEFPMTQDGFRYSVTVRSLKKEAALWYHFRIESGRDTCYLGPDETGFYARTQDTEPWGFRLTVYRADFDTPAWFRRRVMYQIFPDRFGFSDDATAERGITYHTMLHQTPELHHSLDEPVRWQPRPFEKSYAPDDFYGGTLRGIEQKLPYLKKLGVGVIYLNPIVEARSNHRYDTSDYLKVDPILGTNEDFTHLCQEAERQGIRIILDGVYSHTGADSLYFNRYGNYGTEGACQSQDSPFYPWYEFRHYPDIYRSWWGFRDLPEVDELNAEWQKFVITGHDSVVRTWLRRGAFGWRLDVADELPDETLQLIRCAVKRQNPEAPIIGEVWEDAVLKESYGSRRQYALGGALDSVMNYPLRTALLDFIHRRTDAFALRDFLVSQQLNYPQPLYYSLMNLLGSHDVERLMTMMAVPFRVKDLPREQQLALERQPQDYALATAREKLCAAIQFALPGVPSIYYGDEQGMTGGGDPFNRRPFREGDRQLHDYYAELAARRNANAALSTGEAAFEAASSEVLLILRWIRGGRDVFGERAEDSVWLLAVNHSEGEERFAVDFTSFGLGSVNAILGPLEARWIRLE